MSNRNITAILRDIDTIEKSKYLNNTQKAKAIRSLQNEMEEQLGQGELDLNGGNSPTPSNNQGTPKKAA
jgi:hypothetical protein